MAASNPAVEWWETDPESPGNLMLCEIAGYSRYLDCPELIFPAANGWNEDAVVSRPMFEVLPQ